MKNTRLALLIFFMLSCSCAISSNSKILSVQNFPKSSDVIAFYNDMHLRRFNRLATILELALTTEANSLNRILRIKSGHLFLFMHDIEKDDLMRKEFFLQTHEQIWNWRSLPEFIESCRTIGQDVAGAESIAIAQDLYPTYIRKYSPIEEKNIKMIIPI
jgi:hypothetical protein